VRTESEGPALERAYLGSVVRETEKTVATTEGRRQRDASPYQVECGGDSGKNWPKCLNYTEDSGGGTVAGTEEILDNRTIHQPDSRPPLPPNGSARPSIFAKNSTTPSGR
jgi:hypothetical protein